MEDSGPFLGKEERAVERQAAPLSPGRLAGLEQAASGERALGRRWGPWEPRWLWGRAQVGIALGPGLSWPHASGRCFMEVR